jgi:[ribosomal protein S18]-alanine N-acetyltransferase
MPIRWPFVSASKAVIRAASVADAEGISALHRDGGFSGAWSVEEIESLLADRNVITDLAFNSKKSSDFAGFVMSRFAADESEILTIVVARRNRGEGIGRRLLETHLPRLSSIGVKTLYLEVEEENAPARKLYDRMGFVVAGLRKAYYRKPDGGLANAAIMRRSLDQL